MYYFLLSYCSIDLQVRELTRSDIEKELKFAGFVVISCPLKPDSKAVIKEIVGSSHQVNKSLAVVSSRPGFYSVFIVGGYYHWR